MKKVIFVAAAFALAMSSMACGGGRKLTNEVDSLSYAIGGDLGLNINFAVKDLNLDKEMVAKIAKDFIANGDIESEEFQKDMQTFQTFQYTKFMPYMQEASKYENSDQKDTLPALPELYDEVYTRENITRCVGNLMGANIVAIKEELNLSKVNVGIEDGLKVESIEKINEQMMVTTEQMGQLFAAFQQKMMQKQMEELEALKVKNAEESAEWLAEVEKMEGVEKTESGLLYRIDRKGNGKKATNDTDIVKVNYEGKVRSGKVFDSSYERGEAIEFPLNGVIKGWTEGMKLVEVGGQITLWIPAELAYGDRQRSEDIGPNCALEFKVELLDVKAGEKK
ncbi:MAG: FKBP-type peptidyl-prolyl cis-trans isomerase [Alistipes sp.]|nr:FKBP-type peptidyl-prolyl cis-trans isomerase [Alistipes sp.]